MCFGDWEEKGIMKQTKKKKKIQTTPSNILCPTFLTNTDLN